VGSGNAELTSPAPSGHPLLKKGEFYLISPLEKGEMERRRDKALHSKMIKRS